MEEVHPVRLGHLPHVHQLSQQFRRSGRLGSGNSVAGFCRSKVMTDRADAADTLCDLRHFEIGTPFAELFQTTEFINVEKCLFYCALFVEMYGNTSMTFYTRNRFYGYFSGTHNDSPLVIFEVLGR
jgi:hypothetical protein